MQSIRFRFFLAMTAALCAACLCAAGGDSKVQPAQVENGVRSVPAYPVIWPEMPPGPNKDVYLSNCVACHSQLYVLMQPPFPRATWIAEVDKMKKTYGAQIQDAQMPLIVDYLVSIRGAAPSAKKN
ncbi:MAG TPA: hypothetical protein VK797_02865 [Tepidisphaeraceae bacterium]|jgi:hypothetical protein|nr:hypothetical protein [Tepidisphaeraceae bacterium]